MCDWVIRVGMAMNAFLCDRGRPHAVLDWNRETEFPDIESSKVSIPVEGSRGITAQTGKPKQCCMRSRMNS